MSDVNENARAVPRVVVAGLASCFGCQVMITNIEPYLLDLLGQIDLRYWQLASSDPMPADFDIAVIEGAVTTQEAYETVRSLREAAKTVIAIGSCATTAGIPGLAAAGFTGRDEQVYGAGGAPEACGEIMSPVAVNSVIDVDFEVYCCPIDPYKFVEVLQCAIAGSNRLPNSSTLCGECKRHDQGCFFGRQTLCLGLVTRAGCGARCTSLGRPCNGCAGLSPSANVASARMACREAGVSVQAFDDALMMFNQTNRALVAADEQE